MNQALDRREQTQRSQGFQIPPAPTRLPGPQGPAGGEGPQGPPDLSNISIAWETEDVGYFNPEATAQEITKQGGTVYNDVYTFTDRVKYIVTIKGDKVVRLNLIACLRGTAIAWHTTELTDSEKRSLDTLPVQEGWIKQLIKRFKPRTSVALQQLEELSYSYADIRAGKTPRMFVKEFLCSCRAAGFNNEHTQLDWLFSKIHPSLRMTLTRPDENTTLSAFMKQLDDKVDTWNELASLKQAQFEARQSRRPGPPSADNNIRNQAQQPFPSHSSQLQPYAQPNWPRNPYTTYPTSYRSQGPAYQYRRARAYQVYQSQQSWDNRYSENQETQLEQMTYDAYAYDSMGPSHYYNDFECYDHDDNVDDPEYLYDCDDIVDGREYLYDHDDVVDDSEYSYDRDDIVDDPEYLYDDDCFVDDAEYLYDHDDVVDDCEYSYDDDDSVDDLY